MTAAGPADGEPAAVHAWTIHDEFECAHPFTDGNGRTGRLLLNAVRRRYGLSWRVVCDGDAERRSYFANIRDYRAHRFVCRPAGADFSGCE
jgi:fido (protein-threonine AMPylation protein)